MTELEEITIEYEKLNMKKALRAQFEFASLRARIYELTESNARLQATYDHVEEINLHYAELIQSLQNDRKLADMAWTDNQAALKAQAAEIERLKSCKHMHIKIHSRLVLRSTLLEPAEFEYKAECKDCGELFSAEDVDEWAEVEE